MWHTSIGDRILQGDEALLVRAGIDALVDELLIEFDDHWEVDAMMNYRSGVALFDSLVATERLGALHTVAGCLLQEACPPPEKNAVIEATVAAIFLEIRDQVAIEVDFLATVPSQQRSMRWRRLVLAAMEQVRQEERDRLGESFSDDPSWDPPTVDQRNMELWDQVIDILVDQILCDRDFEMAELFMDADPGEVLQRREWLGIDADYFSGVVFDPRPDQVAGLIAETRSWTRGRPR
ncbi:MAG: hypothetical protein AAF989_13840 [Planctomycetota bacterium]